MHLHHACGNNAYPVIPAGQVLPADESARFDMPSWQPLQEPPHCGWPPLHPCPRKKDHDSNRAKGAVWRPDDNSHDMLRLWWNKKTDYCWKACFLNTILEQSKQEKKFEMICRNIIFQKKI